MKMYVRHSAVFVLSCTFAIGVAPIAGDTLPATVSKELHATWSAKEATFNEEATTGVHATVSLTNVSRTSRTSDRILALFFDAENRECFKLAFDLRLSDRAGPVEPGQTRTMFADTSLVFPVSRPTRVEISPFNPAEVSVPSTIVAVPENTFPPIRLETEADDSKYLFVVRASIGLDAHVADFKFLYIREQLPTSQVSTLIRTLRFAVGSEWNSRGDSPLLVIGVVWQREQVVPAMEVPDQNSIIGMATSGQGAEGLPYAEILRFEHKDSADRKGTEDLSVKSGLTIRYDGIGTGWCDPLVRFENIADTVVMKKTWSDEVNKPVLNVQY